MAATKKTPARARTPAKPPKGVPSFEVRRALDAAGLKENRKTGAWEKLEGGKIARSFASVGEAYAKLGELAHEGTGPLEIDAAAFMRPEHAVVSGTLLGPAPPLPASVVPAEFAGYMAAAAWVPVEVVRRWVDNPRDNVEGIGPVADCIEAIGFIAPICLWTSKRRMVAGHTRLSGFEQLVAKHGPSWAPAGAPGPGLVPVRFHEFTGEAEAAAYAIADNRLGEIARWKEDGVRALFLRHREDRVLFERTGFDRSVVLGLADRGGEGGAADRSGKGKTKDEPEAPAPTETPDERDALPAPPEDPRCKPGDLWILGEHRLLCGDSFSAGDRMRLLDGRVAHAVVTDPPYAIYGSSTGIGADIADDKMVRPFFEALFKACSLAVKEFGHVYACCDWRSWAAVWDGAKRGGLAPKNMIVWDKGGGLGSMYANVHELVAFFVRDPPERSMKNGKKAGQRMVPRKNLIKVNRVSGDERVHNAQKPVVLISELVENATDAGETVLDFFGGSGTTLIACEELGRRAFVMETEPRECDKILARWEKHTGKTAELAAAA